MSKSYTVEDDYNDSRLDKWFKNKVINLPHSLLEKILRQNKIKVNKKKTKSSYRLQSGDLIEIYDISKLKPVDKKEKIKYLPKKKIDSNKYDSGQLLLIGGDNEYPGKPKINVSIINNKPFDILNTTITPIRAMHYKLPVLGYRIGGMSYITDTNYISPREKKKIIGSKILILNSLHRKPHISHYNLEQSLALIKELKPEKAYLTHISHEMGTYDSVSKELPKNVFLAYDNLEIPF